MEDFDGRAYLITGGGSGIGAATAAWLADRGAKVTISGRRADKVTAVANQIGPACLAVSGDIKVDADRREMVDAAIAHGGGHLHGLVSNAGNMYRAAIDEQDEAALLDIFHTNVIAGMQLSGLCKAALSDTQGAIIFIGSVHNRRAFPGASPYAATKGALEALTRVLAAELGEFGIRVGCVVPGAVFTEINQRAGLFDDEQARARLDSMAAMHALGRIGEASEISEAIGYLLGAKWTTGAIIDVDGGLGLGLTRA